MRGPHGGRRHSHVTAETRDFGHPLYRDEPMSTVPSSTTITQAPDPLLELAYRYLLATRLDDAAAVAAEQELAAVEPAALHKALAEDAARLAFWIDVYNGAVERHPVRAGASTIDRWRYFSRPVVKVAGQDLSLDVIEHGLLRRSRWKLGLGYVGNPLPGRFEREHRVARLDPRIHFALNCGVASCPPIAAYTADRLEEQLELATRSYLHGESELRGDTLLVPQLMLWYLGDFGGVPGVRRLLRRYGVEGADGRIRFKRYDWTPAPGRWTPGGP